MYLRLVARQMQSNLKCNFGVIRLLLFPVLWPDLLLQNVEGSVETQ